MKSRIHNNIDGAKDCGAYFELPLLQFLRQMPQYAPLIATAGARLDINDPNYVVRFVLSKDGLSGIEVGYPEDAEWQIGQPDRSKQISNPERFDGKRFDWLNKMLDQKLAEGSKILVLPMTDFLKMYPEYGKVFSVEVGDEAICFFRTADKTMKFLTGPLDRKVEKWEQLIQARNTWDWSECHL